MSSKKGKSPPSLTITPVSSEPLNLSPSVASSAVASPSRMTLRTSELVTKIPLPTPNAIGSENTPTPVLIERLFGPVASSNPFDDSFKTFNNARKAKSGENTPTPSVSSIETPKIILNEDHEVKPVIDKNKEKVMRPPSTLVRPLKPIAPTSSRPTPGAQSILASTLLNNLVAKDTPPPTPSSGGVVQQVSHSSAQLLIRMPKGETIHVSELPVSSGIPAEFSHAKVALKAKISQRSPQTTSNETVAKKRKVSETSSIDAERLDLLERNRAAAARSRERKKKAQASREAENDKLKFHISTLTSQNQVLESELLKVKKLLEGYKDSPLAVERGEVDVIRNELSSKVAKIEVMDANNVKQEVHFVIPGTDTLRVGVVPKTSKSETKNNSTRLEPIAPKPKPS